MHPRTSTRVSQPAPRRRLRALVAGGLGAVLATAALALPTQAQTQTGRTKAPQPSDVTMVQANIYTGLSTQKFQADVRTVLAQSPDFVTYNEVPFRYDAVLAPEGYDVWRSTRNRYTAATPVAWRSDRWSALDQGVFRISNWKGRPPGRSTELGRRFANWVTLGSSDGRVVSVVSIHVAPNVKGMPDLRRPSVERLGRLVEKLSPAGPVLVGGDFNVHYRSGIYPRDLFTKASLAPTFDTMGGYFPTGDHRGATIDYVLHRGSELLPTQHRPVELNSDHDAVVAGLTWQVDAPGETTVVVNDPSGDQAARSAAVRALVDPVRSAVPGSVLELATSRLELRALFRQLKRAVRRGVQVRMTALGDPLTPRAARLRRVVNRSGHEGTWFRHCVDACADTWASSEMPHGVLMLGSSDGQWRLRVDSDRRLSSELVERVSRVTVQTGRYGLAAGEQLLRSLR